MNTEKISGLEEKLEYTFKDKELLMLALSHSSYVNELTVRNRQCNERIEFLGDAILEMDSSAVADGLGSEALGLGRIGEADRYDHVTGRVPVAGDEAELRPPIEAEPADPRQQGVAQIVAPRRDLTEDERLHGAQPLRKV